MTTAARIDPRPARRFAVDALHLFALAGFAVAQPLYDLLERTPTFFVAHGATRADLLGFAAALSAGVPALLLGLEAAAAVVGVRLRAALHLLLIGALAALTALPPLHRALAPSPAVGLALAATGGALAAAAYARSAAARLLCGALGLAALVFPLLFLFASPVTELLRAGDAAARPAVSVARPAPVVMLVFDELSLFALLDEQGGIDAGRFPNFAALARGATWYRNATAVADYTPLAVPAILTGRLPDHDRLPTLREHPQNLFTALGGTYRLRVAEPVTELCPRDLCPRRHADQPGDRAALLADTALIYLHMIAPAAWRARLPDIGRQWTFRFQRWLVDHLIGPTREDRPRAFAAFLAGIEPDAAPTLDFAHVLLPHYPYEYLPSGARYDAPPADFHRQRFDPTRPDDYVGWAADNPAGAAQEQQRYLLQLALVDRLLGQLLDRLRETGLYDSALLVVTADHGVSFRPGESQRFVTATNHPDVMWVPLFVKLPGQRQGRVDDRNVQTIDILPTIADALAAAIPWRLDGRSVLPDDAPLPAEKIVYTPASRDDMLALARLVFPAELPRRPAAWTEQARLFGSGTPAAQLFAVGPFPELIGRAVDPTAAPPARFSAALVEPERYRDVDPSRAPLPCFVRGRLTPREHALPPPALAIAVNGVIAATTMAFRADDGTVSFGALLPDSTLRAGANDVECFEVRSGADGLTLRPVRRTS